MLPLFFLVRRFLLFFPFSSPRPFSLFISMPPTYLWSLTEECCQWLLRSLPPPDPWNLAVGLGALDDLLLGFPPGLRRVGGAIRDDYVDWCQQFCAAMRRRHWRNPPPNVWGDTWENFLFWPGSWEAWDIWHGVEIDFEREYGTVWYPWWDNVA